MVDPMRCAGEETGRGGWEKGIDGRRRKGWCRAREDECVEEVFAK